MRPALSTPSLAVFRTASMAVCLAAGIQQFVLVASMGPRALPHLHFTLVDLVWWGVKLAGASPRSVEIGYAMLLMAYPAGLAAFAAALWRSMVLSPARFPTRLLALQVVLALLVNPQLLYIVAAELPLLLPLQRAWRWLAAQAVAFTVLRLARLAYLGDGVLACSVTGAPLPPASIEQRVTGTFQDLLMGLVFQALAFAVGLLAAAERRRRRDIAVAHAGLLATRRLAAEAAAAGERVRVARELHDAIGHQLTAMSLHLDLAVRQSGPVVAESLQAAHGLAQRMLAGVRQLVRSERQASNDDTAEDSHD